MRDTLPLGPVRDLEEELQLAGCRLGSNRQGRSQDGGRPPAVRGAHLVLVEEGRNVRRSVVSLPDGRFEDTRPESALRSEESCRRLPRGPLWTHRDGDRAC